MVDALFEINAAPSETKGTPAKSVDGSVRRVQPMSAEIRRRYSLDSFYQKHVDLDGFLVISSSRVSDNALLEASYLLDNMLANRNDIRRALVASHARCVVMAIDEYTTDLPEQNDLEPTKFWDRRARGLGGTVDRPIVSCGAENSQSGVKRHRSRL
jgi:hypothetical protein